MRIRESNPARAAAATVALLAAVVLAGCGGSGERAADSGGLPDPALRLASVDVTYYFLPG